MDATLAFAFALLAGGYLPTAPGPTLLASCVTLVVVRKRVSTAASAVAVLLLLLAAFRAHRTVDAFVRERAAVREALARPSRCSARALVMSSPVLARDKSARQDQTAGVAPLVPSWDAELSATDCEGRAIEPVFRARIYGGPSDLGRGDTVQVIADLAPVQLFRNDDLPDPRPGAARRRVTASGGAQDVRLLAKGYGLGGLIDRLRAHVRRRIVATFVPDAEPMARALVLGETDLSDDDTEAFRTSGLAHLLAVSGTHLVLVVAGTVAALTALLRRSVVLSACRDVGRWTAGFGVVLAWVYADFAGGSGSANRAAAMLSCVLLARMLGRRADGARAFAVSLCGASLCDPLVGFDLSFLLSIASTAGLMLLQPVLLERMQFCAIRLRLASWPGVDTMLRASATTIAATLGCSPLVALLSPTLPIGGIPANLLAVPLGELAALPLCLAHASLAFAPTVERGAALVGSGSLILVRAIARFTSGTPWLALTVPRPSAWQCALMAVAVAASWATRSGRRTATAIIAFALLVLSEVAAARAARPLGRLRVTVLDVGQGDATLVDLPDGTAMLIDAGGMVGSPVDTGELVITPLLRVRRRSALATVVLSHPHPDHFGGLRSTFEHVGVAAFWDTGQGEREGAGRTYAGLLAALRMRGVPIVRPDALCGAPRSLGGATVEVLAPCPDIVPFANANDNSVVLRIRYGRRTALLVGDAEQAEEERLLREHPSDLGADFLKAGHHGSRTSSSPAFLAAVHPSEVAISCGVRNRFGHPHPTALAALSAVARVHRTDRVGSVAWETDGQEVRIHEATEDDW